MNQSVSIHIRNATIMMAAASPAAVTGIQLDSILTDIESLSVPASTVPQVGKPWPEEKGFLLGIMPAEGDHPAYYLIKPDDPAAEAEKLTFGGYGKEIAGLSNWDGLANTKVLLASGHDHPAAKFCADLVIDGRNDFYLMSQREAALAYATAPHLFKKGWHWTSSQYSASNAFIQGFSSGFQDVVGKHYAWRVCAVRRIPLIN